MRHSTVTAKNRRESRFLGQRRISFLSRRNSKQNFNFIKINKGSVSVCCMPWGAYKASFSSKSTGRTAFAYGADFGNAYKNLVRLFNLKYSV